MDSGFAGFIGAVIFMGVLLGGSVFCFWALNTKQGQRIDRKQQIRNGIREGMRDAEIEDGLLEEVVREIAAKEARKRSRA